MKFFFTLKIILILSILFSSFSFSEDKPSKKNKSSSFLGKIIEKEKKKYEPIDYKDVADLGVPSVITDLPEGMIKKFGGACKQFNCRTKKATQIMSKAFKRFAVLGPPDPAIKPVLTFEIKSSFKLASLMASFIAIAV